MKHNYENRNVNFVCIYLLIYFWFTLWYHQWIKDKERNGNVPVWSTSTTWFTNIILWNLKIFW